MNENLRESIRERYAAAVGEALAKKGGGCCGSGPETACKDPITRDLYAPEEAAGLPEEALLASFGCGNPTALAELRPGEVVLDLGSGGGIDVLLSARRVGPTGKAYGLDMTDEMLAVANENKRRAGLENVEFRRGTIEDIPLPDASVDVIISNCVINLSPDKDRVLAEAFRVLRPGGRFAVSDIVLRRPLPDAVRASVEAWTGCVAGALLEGEYASKLRAAGFVDVGIEPTRVYDRSDAEEVLGPESCCGRSLAAEVDGAVMSAFIRARKPLT